MALIYGLEQRSDQKKAIGIVIGIFLGILALWVTISIPALYNVIGYRMEGLLSVFSNSSLTDASTTGRITLILEALKLFPGARF